MAKAIERMVQGYRFRGKKLPTPPRVRISKRADYSGKRFGRCVAVECLGVGGSVGGNRFRWWGCVCDCGTRFAVRSVELQRGHTKSCGCLAKETRKQRGGQNKLPAGEAAFRGYLQSYQRSAKARGIEWALTEDQFRDLVTWRCYYCGEPPNRPAARHPSTNGDFLCSGVDRINNNRGYTINNVRSCCKQCNIAKGTLGEAEFLGWIHRVYKDWAHKFRDGATARFEHGERDAINALLQSAAMQGAS